MSDLCVIKANSHGINLLLDENADFEELITEICRQFASGRDFFGAAEIILQVSGRKMSMEELRVVVQAIELNSDIKVKLISESDPEADARTLTDIKDYFEKQRKERLRILPDSIAIGAALAFDESVVVMGDVKRGASLAASGNVIIMGGLYGSVACGGTSDKSCFVAVAGNVESTDVAVGGVKGELSVPEEPRHGLFHKKDQEHDVTCFCVYGGKLVMEPMKEGIISELLG